MLPANGVGPAAEARAIADAELAALRTDEASGWGVNRKTRTGTRRLPRRSNWKPPDGSCTRHRGFMRTMFGAMSGTFSPPSVSSTPFPIPRRAARPICTFNAGARSSKRRPADWRAIPTRRRRGENNESPLQQLERYLLSELRRDKEMFAFDEDADRPWVGVLTDGRVWHAWLYDHRNETRGRTVLDRFVPGGAEDLIRRIRPLVSGDPIGKPWVPSDPRPLFEPAHDELQAIYSELSGANLAETRTKRDLWLDMLRTASMEPENETARDRLFVTHSFLVALARGVIHTLGEPNGDPDPTVVLEDGFAAWILATTRGRGWAARLLERVHGYEWRRRRGDVLRPLYERFVGERDRKVFGEYYTPDWLAGLIVEELLDEAWCDRAIAAAIADERNQARLEGVGFLDPACGSGTILYFAAQRLLGAPALEGHTAARRAAVVARLVNGIDVHPVAAEISRATLLRALPAEPPGGKAGIRIYEGDSLLVNADDETSLFRPMNGEIRIVTPQGRELLLPRSFVDLPTFTDDLRRLVQEASTGRPLSADIGNSVPEADRAAVKACHAAFIEIVAREGNSVWTWYIANTTGPIRLSDQKVDRIVANPPWVSMADIQAEVRKRDLEQFADADLDLWTGGRNAPHFDIAQLFIKRARQLYLANPDRDPAAWIVKKSALRAESWARFREWHGPVLAQSLDLEAARPFGRGRCPPMLRPVRTKAVRFSGAGQCGERAPGLLSGPQTRGAHASRSGERPSRIRGVARAAAAPGIRLCQQTAPNPVSAGSIGEPEGARCRRRSRRGSAVSRTNGDYRALKEGAVEGT